MKKKKNSGLLLTLSQNSLCRHVTRIIVHNMKINLNIMVSLDTIPKYNEQNKIQRRSQRKRFVRVSL